MAGEKKGEAKEKASVAARAVNLVIHNVRLCFTANEC